jgi:hypothetical protein
MNLTTKVGQGKNHNNISLIIAILLPECIVRKNNGIDGGKCSQVWHLIQRGKEKDQKGRAA